MPVNRFDRSQGQQYTSTYVPMPLEQIGDLAKQYQGHYQTGQALPQQLDILGQAIKAAPVDFENKARLIDEYKGRLGEIVNTAKPEDFARPEYQQKVNSIIYQFKNDPRVNAITNNKEVFDKVYTPYLSSKDAKKDLILTNVMSKEHSSGYKQMKPGESLAPLDYITHEDSLKGAKTIMDDIKIDGKSLSGIGEWAKDNNYFLKSTGHEKQILEAKVRNVAKANIGNYAENSEGRFRFKTLLNQVGLDPHMSYSDFKYAENIDPKIKQAIDSELENDLFNYGSKQIFKDVESSYDVKGNQLRLHAAKKDINESITPGLLQSIEGAPISMVSPEMKALFDDGIINDKGEIDYSSLSKTNFNAKASTKEAGNRVAKMGGWLNLDMASSSTKDYTNADRLAKVAVQAAKILGKTDKVTSENIPTILKEYNEFMSVKGYMGNKYDGIDKTAITQQVINDPTNYEFLDGKLQVSDDAKKVKETMFDTQVNKFTINSRVNIDGKSYLQGSVIDKKTGETKEVYIRPRTKEFNQHFDNIAKVADSMKDYYTGKYTPVKSSDAAFGNQLIISQTEVNGGRSIIRVYKDPNDPNDREQVVKYDIEYVPGEVKGKYDTRLTNREIVGNSFKEYQQGEHVNYGYTKEGRKMYETVAPKKDAWVENVTPNEED